MNATLPAGAHASDADAVLCRIEGFVEDAEAERLRLYRLHLQATVRRVSPLIVDLAAYAGSRLRTLVEDLRPPPSWPWSMPGHRLHNPARLGAGPGLGRGTPTPRAMPGLNRKAGATHALNRTFDGMRGELTLMVVGGRLEALVSLGTTCMQTQAGVASVMLPDPLPETIVAALPGRSVEDLFQHPIIDGRGYVVDQVHPPAHWPGHVVTFHTGLLPFDMPWEEELVAELEDRP